MKHFIVSIEKDTDGSYIAYNVDDSDFTLLGRGASVAEARADFNNSIKEIQSSFQDRGIAVPEELTAVPEFKFDLSSLFEYYSMINVSAFARYLGINPALMRQYKKGDVYVSEKQLKKIEDGIHTLGKELASLSIV
jgi:hypothetical protein